MELLESLEFIENNWDICHQDPQISKALDESVSSVSHLESFYINQVEKFEKDFLQTCTQSLEMKDIFDQIQSASDLINDSNLKLGSSIGELQALQNTNEPTTNIARDILDFFRTYLPIISKFKIKKSEIVKTHLFLNKYPGLKDIYTYKISKFSNKKRSKFNNCRSYIVYNVSQGYQKKEKEGKKCHKYYEFFKQMVSFDQNYIKSLQEECVTKLVKNIISVLFKKNPFNPFPGGSDEIIKTFLSLEVLTPKNIPQYKYNVKKEFRIIKFIIELPDRIEKAIDDLRSMFNDELFSFSEYFTEKLKNEYINYLKDNDFNKGSDVENAMSWCLVFRVIAFHNLTAEIKSPYQACVMEMIQQTIEISNIKSNNIYEKYTDKSRSPLLCEYQKLISKGQPHELTDYKLQENYVMKMISILQTQIHPALKKISLYYAEIIKHRSNFAKSWYSRIIKTIVSLKNEWFLHFVPFLGGTVMYQDWSSTIDFNEKLFLTFIAFLNLYVICYEDLYINAVGSIFNEYFGRIVDDQRFDNKNIKPFVQKNNIIPIDAKFYIDNFNFYITEVKALVLSKLEILEREEEKSFFAKVKDEFTYKAIPPKDKLLSGISLVFLFAIQFSNRYYSKIKGLNKDENAVLPGKDKVFKEIMLIITEKYKIKPTLFSQLFFDEFNTVLPITF